MKRIIYIIPFTLFLFSSCLRDEIEPCPPLQVNIDVKDKNYFNVDKIELEEKKSEELPFRKYVQTLRYALRELKTGKVVEEATLFEVTGNEKRIPVTFCDCIPHGTYVLTVWGGLKSEKELSKDALSAELHMDGTEGEDVYLTNDTLLYDAWSYTYTVDLERTKGKLLIESVGLPATVDASQKSISKVFDTVENTFDYSGNSKVEKEYAWKESSDVISRTWLAPSLKEKASVLKIDLYKKGQPDIPAITPKAVNITMERNMITVLRYVYDGDECTIYVLLNDTWEVIYDMGIE